MFVAITVSALQARHVEAWGGGGGKRGRGLSAQLLLLKNQAKAHKNQHARHTWVCMALFLIALCEVHQSKHVSCCLY